LPQAAVNRQVCLRFFVKDECVPCCACVTSVSRAYPTLSCLWSQVLRVVAPDEPQGTCPASLAAVNEGADAGNDDAALPSLAAAPAAEQVCVPRAAMKGMPLSPACCRATWPIKAHDAMPLCCPQGAAEGRAASVRALVATPAGPLLTAGGDRCIRYWEGAQLERCGLVAGPIWTDNMGTDPQAVRLGMQVAC
jgi:hypothetical protein